MLLLVFCDNPAYSHNIDVYQNSGRKSMFSLFSQRNCRYDGQIAVFGKNMQETLAKQRYFLVSDN